VTLLSLYLKVANVANYLKPKGRQDNKNFKKLIYRENSMICKQKLVPLKKQTNQAGSINKQ
jgi:hypothetical protein